MLLLKRLLTAFVLFVFLSIILSVGAMAMVGGIVGARAASNGKATDFNSGYAAGHAAGAEVGKQYGGVILLGALGVSAIASLAISFTGILPWCRKKPLPPPLPAV